MIMCEQADKEASRWGQPQVQLATNQLTDRLDIWSFDYWPIGRLTRATMHA
jgi:hypothetical protein